MKKMIMIVFLLTVVFSCGNDDESNDQDLNESIIGNWKLVEWYDDIPRDINNDGNATTDLFSQWDGCKKQSTLVLFEDNTGRIVYNGENNNPRCPSGFETNDFFTIEPWELDESNNKFILAGDDTIDEYEIVTLNSETLILEGAGFYSCCDASISYFTDGYLKFEKE